LTEPTPTNDEPAGRTDPPVFNDVRDDYDEHFALTPFERARIRLQGPAIAFLIIGVMGFLGAIVGAIAIVSSQYRGAMRSEERLAILIVCLSLVVLGSFLFVVVFIAGFNMLRMQHRGLALVAAYIVTGLSIAGLYAIFFFPFGIWALIVLHQPDVRKEFYRPWQVDNRDA
jgi:hypothetical protein